MKKKHQDLQPWLDYFAMLRTYELNGYLEMMPDKHDAFISQAALFTLTPGGDNPAALPPEAIPDTVRRIRAYAAFCARQGDSYLSEPFALHIVQDEPPHDPLHTVLLTQESSWRTAWRTREKVNVINYTETEDKPNNESDN